MAHNLHQFKTKLRAEYEAGVQSGDIFYTPSGVTTLSEGSIDFEIRLAKAAAKKPVPEDGQPKQKKDPFEAPYGPHSFVAEFKDDQDDEEFVILLNKFCVVPRHFLLVTKNFAPQTSPPSPAELYASFTLLSQMEQPSEGFEREPHVGIFNCGEQSGASQPHKHLQFTALQSGKVPFEEEIWQSRPSNYKQDSYWSMAVEIMPAAHFIADIRSAADESASAIKELLTTCFMALLDAGIQNNRHLSAQNQQEPQQEGAGKVRRQMSYNLVMTTKFMLLVPRTQSDYILPPEYAENSEDLSQNKLSLNALAFAGLILVKSEKHRGAVQDIGVREILRTVGMPRAEAVANLCQ